MRNLRVVLVTLLVLALLVAGALFAMGYFQPDKAGLFIETTPAATVYLDGQQVGRTPFRQTVEPGETTLKLVPDSFETPLAPFESRLVLVSGIETHVQREFGDSDETSSGAVVSFEKGLADETSIAIISIPDAAEIRIDGSVRGFAPYKTNSITPGDHQISVLAPGYLEKTISAKAIQGYKLTAVINLAPDPQGQPEEEAVDAVEMLETRVRILETSTGFLRVRSGPSTANEEVGRVTPGETYVLVETDEETGWFKIVYKEDEEGWVTNEFADIVEEDNVSQSPSPSPTP